MEKRTKLGFVVVDSSEDWEQTLTLNESSGMPPGGVLEWRDCRDAAYVFPTRKDARAAIDRTEHYRIAFGSPGHPEKRCCKLVAVEGGN